MGEFAPTVEVLSSVTEEDAQDIAHLLIQLSKTQRGKGVARALLLRIIEIATERGLRTLDLTSRPSRDSALRLYESVGFARRETNVLRFTPPALS